MLGFGDGNEFVEIVAFDRPFRCHVPIEAIEAIEEGAGSRGPECSSPSLRTPPPRAGRLPFPSKPPAMSIGVPIDQPMAEVTTALPDEVLARNRIFGASARGGSCTSSSLRA
jgi:hypothetical protein